MLMLRLASSGAAAENDVSAGENLFELDTLNAQCHKPTSPTTSASFTPVAGPPPAVTSENFWPPPPPPEVTSENFWPPPPSHAVTSEDFWLPPPPLAVTSENFWPPPPSHAVTSEDFWLPPPPLAVTSENFWPPPPSYAVTSEHFWLPPPPPAVTSENFWPPPPPPPMTTGTAAFRRYPAVQKPCASVRGAEGKKLQTYCRVFVTELRRV
ncbi:unnamed protein product [Macrosiphum euphorbiae]|uniref:Uncharacterized protein n=1 Tax=Macrosiphum euphorbiae TaxID=13131 RepID=A0AAV0W561_9HEMI|nr:unnamed protein product [Macrosiphum euphorbiae]